MAEEETNDIKEDDLELGAASKKKGFLGKLLKKEFLIIFGVMVLVIAVSVGLTFWLVGGKSGGDESEEEMVAEETVEKEDSKGEKDKKKKKKSGKGNQAIYYSLEPAFVVNFSDKSGLRYLQITMDVLVKNQRIVDELKKHKSIIRNNIVLYLSSQTYDIISTREGKQKIRADVLKELKKILKEKTGEPGVEAVYFTSFVVQ